MKSNQSVFTVMLLVLPLALGLGEASSEPQQDYDFVLDNGPGGNHVFSNDISRALHQTNATLPKWVFDLPDGGCLRTIYFGFKSIYGWSDDDAKSFQERVFKRSDKKPSINFAMQELHATGLSDRPTIIKHLGNKDSDKYADSLEQTVLKLAKKEGGMHFFALAVNGGFHSVLLAVGESKNTRKWEVYWFDQSTKGFNTSRTGWNHTNRVTGKLDQLVVSPSFKSKNYGWSDIEISHLKRAQ